MMIQQGKNRTFLQAWYLKYLALPVNDSVYYCDATLLLHSDRYHAYGGMAHSWTTIDTMDGVVDLSWACIDSWGAELVTALNCGLVGPAQGALLGVISNAQLCTCADHVCDPLITLITQVLLASWLLGQPCM